ncbi:hypothetical protein KXW36_009901 [Aspergillus fumigatus]|nr:hypothetical protein KXW36_009901 [Aspergillus fumigatus]
MLGPRHAQAGKAIALHGALPTVKFLKRQAVTEAGFLDGQQSTVDGGYHFRLAPNDPAACFGRWQGFECQRLAKRANYHIWTYFLIFDHRTPP